MITQLIGIVILLTAAFVLALILQCLHAFMRQNDGHQQIQTMILDLLPQTQCGQCGYPGCAPYAKALADGEAINLCPPGGEPLVQQLSERLNRPIVPLAKPAPIEPMVAIIREEECIGCAKCGPVCPVDAIVGAARMMHTVILADCTGCELCLQPCPVDCIDLVPASEVL